MGDEFATCGVRAIWRNGSVATKDERVRRESAVAAGGKDIEAVTAHGERRPSEGHHARVKT